MEDLQKKMKVIRKYYNLSKISMSRICGFGDNQWRLYENGEAEPNKSNLKIIKTVFRPLGFRHMVRWADSSDIHGLKKAREISKGTVKTLQVDIDDYKDRIDKQFIKTIE